MNYARCWRPLSLVLITQLASAACAVYPDRFVFVFGWNLRQDSDVAAITQVLDTAAAHGCNGVVLRANLDSISRQDTAYCDRLRQLQALCDRSQLELIPLVFSVGYGPTVLERDPNLAEGFPVRDALFVAGRQQAQLLADPPIAILNGDFEQSAGDRFAGLTLQDAPGTISHVDKQIYHSGRASARLDNFATNPYGHGRLSQRVPVRPYRCYRLTVWGRSENLQPEGCFRGIVQGIGPRRDLAQATLDLPANSAWRKLTMLFNSMEYDHVNVYVGVWGGREGQAWVDDWQLEEVGPLNVLRRPGTPVTVRSDDGAVTYQEGQDYAPLVDPDLLPWGNFDRPAPVLRLLPGTRIQPGAPLRISWYHPLSIFRGQVCLCMAEPQVYEIWEQEARMLAQYLHPKRFLLSMDEIREAGTCAACQGQDLSQLLASCLTRQMHILRSIYPDAQIYTWSDMIDPTHNGRDNYFMTRGDFSRTWQYVPRDLIMTTWGRSERLAGMRFFSEHGFATLGACYYDAPDLEDVRAWLQGAQGLPGVRGFMYTSWQRKYDLLGDFGDLIDP